MRRMVAALFAMIAVGLGIFYTLHLKLYPAVIVNGTLVGSRTLAKESAAAYRYYEKALALYAKKADTPDPRSLKLEVERATLASLIEDVLISKKLREETGNGLEALVAEKVQSVDLSSNETLQAMQAILGLDVSQFKEMVLVPQARRIILATRFGERKESFDTWLAAAKRSARVVVIRHLFRWDGEEVRLK